MSAANPAPRSDAMLFAAWVAAAAIGAAVAWGTAGSVSNLFSNDLVGGAIATALRAAPIALLQYLVLRSLIGIRSIAAGVWVGCSLLAAALWVPATVTWVEQGISRLPVWVIANSGLMDFAMRGDQWIYALLFGLAQGLVLANVFRRKVVVAVWVGANLLAIVVASYVALFATSTALVLSAVGFSAVYAAITGVTLVVIVRQWGPLRAPAPAARLLPAPRP